MSDKPYPKRRRIESPDLVHLCSTPQDMVYAILTGDKMIYTKIEVLSLIDKLTKILSPHFDGDIEYVS
jgi:hypothetical protein